MVTKHSLKLLTKLIEAGGEIRTQMPNHAFAGRMRDEGLIEIIDTSEGPGWPWNGWFIRITDAGRALARG